ncbi:phage baseplate assembly protein [Pseudomonas fontis]|uniref:Baseplate protein n=1 Tax=Pseudomonas fontis TaxID=2942633 RepID=A0ABT5NPL7_9PSED|nr:baseplate protein [Pseudomonas fontis]MDD0972441.1 baseplate protein [Pseudomonas fontis]MDD0990102.1 baseplate protein [Pseudomonas fontis]
MTDPQNVVTLTVGGLDYAGWKSIKIIAGFEQQARTFELGITWQWPGRASSIRIVPGDRCEVRIGNDLVLTGWVWATPIAYDSAKTTLTVQGSSLTVDLVECSAINQPGQWCKQTLLQIAQALAAPYGVQVVSELGALKPIPTHSIVPGETVFKSLDRLLTLQLAYSSDDPQGRLVLTRPGSGGEACDGLALGRNVLSASAQRNSTQCFSEYRLITQRQRSEADASKDACEVEALSHDRSVRKRVLVLVEGNQMHRDVAQQRIDWERRSREAQAWEATYVVQGWRQSNGELWRPNTLVWVHDPIIGLDRQVLIAKVTYALDDKGTLSTLEVAPAAKFELNPTDPQRLGNKA